MAVITLIDLSTPNDGLGDPLRDGGDIININFQNLNKDKLEIGGYLGNAQNLKDDITALDTAKVSKTGDVNETITGVKTFSEDIIGDLDGRALPRATTTAGTNGASDGVGAWTKLADIDFTGNFKYVNYIFAITSTNSGTPGVVIFNLAISRNAGATPLEYDLKVLRQNGGAINIDGLLVGDDSVAQAQLWMQKNVGFGTFDLYCLAQSQSTGATISYETNYGWQATKPVFTEDELASSYKTNPQIGWGNYADGESSPATLTINTTPSLLQIDGLGASTETDYLPEIIKGVSELWTSNAITPIGIGDAYTLRIDFEVTAESGNPNEIILQLDIGGGASPTTVIVDRYITAGKGTPYNVSVGFPIFTLSTFVTNGGQIFLSTDTGTVTVASRGILISKISS